MPLPVTTTQIGTVIANAGLTQTVNITEGSGSIGGSLAAPGFATATGAPATSTGTPSTQQWPIYLVMLALFYSSFQWIK